MKPRMKTLLLTTLPLALAIGACTPRPTPYQPATASSPRSSGYGYEDFRIEANRYRVSFSGNSVTSRETVERYLLYRAAQLTVERGYDWFAMADRDTERKSRTYIDQPFYGGAYGYWGPYWRYRGIGAGWRYWDPFWGDPFWDRNIDVRTIDRYEATAEIILGKGRKPVNDRRAFDAREVLGNLGPSIRVPEDRY